MYFWNSRFTYKSMDDNFSSNHFSIHVTASRLYIKADESGTPRISSKNSNVRDARFVNAPCICNIKVLCRTACHTYIVHKILFYRKLEIYSLSPGFLVRRIAAVGLGVRYSGKRAVHRKSATWRRCQPRAKKREMIKENKKLNRKGREERERNDERRVRRRRGVRPLHLSHM